MSTRSTVIAGDKFHVYEEAFEDDTLYFHFEDVLSFSHFYHGDGQMSALVVVPREVGEQLLKSAGQHARRPTPPDSE